jgi:membrane protein implicated in regulation of membrane protease activity
MHQVYIANMGWGTRIMAILGAAIGIAIAVAFVVLSLGLALILLPIVAVAAAIGWWRWRKVAEELRKQTGQERPASSGFRVIETDYEVVPPGDRRDR